MRCYGVIDRVRCLRRRPRAAVRFAVILGAALFWRPSAGGADPPSTIGVELNRLEDQGGNCRAYLVVTNPGSAEFSSFSLDLILFDHGGTIMRRLAVDLAPVRVAKTTVKIFDISETACGTIGSILVNDVIHCRDASGDVAGCIDRVSTSSKLAVSLLK
ncbi:MAG TPA: Tat pathway signal sequence domain protein [Stellaceae bacterium]